jgi:hypothetical protein
MGFRTLALVAPEPGKAGGGPQLEQLCALPFGNSNGLAIAPFGRRPVTAGGEQVP